MRDDKPITITPEMYEREVKRYLDRQAGGLTNYRSEHRRKVVGLDGEYEIDVLASFEALGFEIKVVVECKHYQSRIKREVIQILRDRLRSIGAHKGVLFTASAFQKGAVEYATRHGIALMQLKDGDSQVVTLAKSFHGPLEAARPRNLPVRSCVGYFVSLTEQGHVRYTLVSSDGTGLLHNYLYSPQVTTE